MKKLKKILIFFIILSALIFFISFTFVYSKNIKHYIPENTVIYINLPFNGLKNLKQVKPLEKISLINEKFKSVKKFQISDIENLGIAIVKNDNNIDLGLSLDFKQKDKFKNLVDLEKDSILKLDSTVLGFRTSNNVFNQIRNENFNNNFLHLLWSKIKITTKTGIGNIYFNFNQFNSGDNYFNNISGLKSSVLSFDKKNKEIKFEFKNEFYLNYQLIKDKNFEKPFVLGYKENNNIQIILDNLKKNFALQYPVLKQNILPDGSKFLEKIADPEEFVFKKKEIIKNKVYILDNKNLNLLVSKLNNNCLLANDQLALKKYLQTNRYIKQKKDLFFYIPNIDLGIKSLFLKQVDNLTQAIIKI